MFMHFIYNDMNVITIIGAVMCSLSASYKKTLIDTVVVTNRKIT